MSRQKSKPDDEKIHRQYILSHHSYKPGERRNHYEKDWKAPEHEKSILEPETVSDLLYWNEERERYKY